MALTGESSRRSCLECHRRKIKCDKSHPCSYCVKIGIDCRYPPPRHSRERHVTQEASTSITDTDVFSRIKRIEQNLETFGRSLSQISQLVLSSPLSQPLAQSRADLQRQREGEEHGSFTQWGPRSSPFRVVEKNSLNTPASTNTTSSSEASFHTTTILSLWQRFLERVDPVLKMIHVPTTQQKIVDVATARVTGGIEMQALIGSICYSAVVTTSVDECWHEFGRGREEILGEYRARVEKSLTAADFLQSTDMTLLQAFTIYIICGRFDKRGPDVKHLTSLAIKTAQKNGLDKIDSNSMLSPFESEMRRRIWWQLYTLDVRNAEDHGLEPCISEPSVTTRLPLSINDLNLHPGMSEIRQSSSERTEMLFTLNRHNTSTLVRRIMFSDSFCQQNAYPVLSISEKCDEIDIAREKIEEQILALCNHDIPVDYITAASSRLVLAKLKLNVIKPKARQNQHIITQEGFRRTCVEILKSARALRCYENGKQWLWLFQTYVEWDALTYLFINLSLVPSGSTTDSAWQAAEDIYEYWRNHSEVVFDDRWKQIEGLRSHAFSARQMYRDNPAQFGPLPTEFDSPGGPSMMLSTRVEEAGLGGGHAGDLNLQSEITGGTYNPQPTDAMGVQASSQGKLTEACANVLEPGSSVDPLDISIPTTGTSCQWSAALFDRYFQVLDSEQNMAMSWL